MQFNNEFFKYATKHQGINSNTLDQFVKASVTPVVIEERQLNAQPIDVFSRLMMDRIIFLGMPISDEVANIVQAQLLFLDSNEPGKDIQIYINSPGGYVFGGLGIYDTMQYVSADISTICTGIAASMGAFLLAAGNKGKRSALKHSRIMIHQPSGTIGGQASNIEIYTKLYQDLKKDLYKILADHTGQTVEKIEKDSDRDFWMTAYQAKEYGLIDEVLEKHV
ncbi:MAG: ATP-dependent Clp protease proteolytic subunit [Bacteroidota bacterium]